MLRRSLCSLGVLGLVMAFPVVADASLQVTLSAGASSTTIVDGGAGDFDAMVNQVIVIPGAIVGGYTFTFTLVTDNSPGTPGLAFVDTSTAVISDSGGGATTVSIYANATGFTAPITPPALVASSDLTANFFPTTPSGNTATAFYSALIDTTNAATTTPAGTVVGSGSDALTQPSNSGTFLMDSTLVTSLSSPYALNMFLAATLDQRGSAIDLDGGLQLNPVPEPGTIVVWSLLSVLGGAAYLKLRR